MNMLVGGTQKYHIWRTDTAKLFLQSLLHNRLGGRKVWGRWIIFLLAHLLLASLTISRDTPCCVSFASWYQNPQTATVHSEDRKTTTTSLRGGSCILTAMTRLALLAVTIDNMTMRINVPCVNMKQMIDQTRSSCYEEVRWWPLLWGLQLDVTKVAPPLRLWQI